MNPTKLGIIIVALNSNNPKKVQLPNPKDDITADIIGIIL